jgi:anti-anti-sigma factor
MPPHEGAAPQEAVLVRLESSGLGEFDAESALGSLLELASLNAGRDLWVDLSKLNYIGSTALGLFVRLDSEVRSAGGRLRLLNAAPTVYEAFELTRLTDVLEVRHA